MSGLVGRDCHAQRLIKRCAEHGSCYIIQIDLTALDQLNLAARQQAQICLEHVQIDVFQLDYGLLFIKKCYLSISNY
jgi:hypothetical protein